MKQICFCLFLCFVVSKAHAQARYSIIQIIDSLTQHPLQGAEVRFSASKIILRSDNLGKVKYHNNVGLQRVQVTYPNYVSFEKILTIAQDSVITILLRRQTKMLQEVVVKAASFQERVTANQMSTVEITARQLETIPSLLGEKDVVKALFLTPGVKTQTEGSTAMYVRGGGPDQNLLLFNGKPLYYASHLFGLLTPYNPDILAKASLSKGGFPAWYGGRLSSVLDVVTRPASMQRQELSASIGLLAGRVTIGQPLIKDQLSLLVAGRRSFIDALLLPAPNAPIPNFSFFDVDAKLTYLPKTGQQLSFFVHSDQDVIKYRQVLDASVSKTDFRWKNQLGGLDWHWTVDENFDLTSEAGYSAYHMQVVSETADGAYVQKNDFMTSLTDYYLKAQLNYKYQNTDHTVGIQYTRQPFNPGSLLYQTNNEVIRLRNSKAINAQSTSIYYQLDFQVLKSLKGSLGARFNVYRTTEKAYFSPEPRLSFTKQINATASVKASYSRMQQPIHLLSNPGLGVPLDLWYPASQGIAPASAQQIAVGYFRQLDWHESNFLLTVESYYKDLRRIITYKDGNSSTDIIQFNQLANPSFTDLVTIGKGRSWGVEMLLEKKGERLSGWLGYTLAWTQQRFPDLNLGNWFFPRYDRRHDISLTVSYHKNKRWHFNANWTYGSGQAITLPVLAYQVPSTDFIDPTLPYSSQILYTQGARNAYRMRAYHRLDIALQRKYSFRWGESTFEFGLYNAYSRRNPFIYQLGIRDGKPGVQAVSLLPILPSISYSIKIK